MLVAAAVLLILSIAGLIAAVTIGTPAPDYPRHGTFGIAGFDSSFVAWACVGMCAVGLVLLFIDSRRPKPEPTEPEEHEHTAGDELFGDHEVERDLARDN